MVSKMLTLVNRPYLIKHAYLGYLLGQKHAKIGLRNLRMVPIVETKRAKQKIQISHQYCLYPLIH